MNIEDSPAGAAASLPLFEKRRAFCGLLVWGKCWRISFRGKLLLVIVGFGLGFGLRETAHPFLAVSAPLPAELLVVEGWISGYGLETALAEFKKGGCRRILTAGGITRDGWSSEPRYTFADECADA